MPGLRSCGMRETAEDRIATRQLARSDDVATKQCSMKFGRVALRGLQSEHFGMEPIDSAGCANSQGGNDRRREDLHASCTGSPRRVGLAEAESAPRHPRVVLARITLLSGSIPTVLTALFILMSYPKYVFYRHRICELTQISQERVAKIIPD